MGVIEGIALKGLTALTAKLINKFTELGWNKVVEEFNASLNHGDLKRFCKACDEYVNIRTLYSSQKDIFIDDVYVPLFMSPSNDKEKKYEISNLSIYSEGITNIIGGAGQGKSTFLRKMLINELKIGETIPVFFELKYINPEESFLSQLSKWFSRHNLEISTKGVERLLRYGYLKLFLDGFDEVHPSKHDEALANIKDLSRAFPKATIIVTSRPDTLITTEPLISNYTVLNLTTKNINQLFLNISENNIEKSKEAMEQLDKYPNIRDIVKTPILAILLFITYRVWSKVPDNLADFYKKIFITLLTHHDSLKPGKKIDRGINIPLNDHQIEDIFSVFCFTTFSENASSFSTKEAVDYMELALKSECLENVCSRNLIGVIKQCTGVICGDGYDQLSFSHKSLQEYYTSVYISKQRVYDKRIFYSSVKTVEQENQFRAVLKFLSAIDTHDYVKYYYIPCFKEMFDTEKASATISENTINTGLQKLINNIEIPFADFQKNIEKNKGGKLKTLNLGLKFVLDDNKSSLFYLRLMQPLMFCLIASGIYHHHLVKHNVVIQDKIKEGKNFDMPLSEVIIDMGTEKTDEFMDSLTEAFNELITSEHEHLMELYKNKSKPSLLSQTFKKKPEAKQLATSANLI